MTLSDKDKNHIIELIKNQISRYLVFTFLLPIIFGLLPVPSLAWESGELIRIAVFKGKSATVGGDGISIYGIAGGERIPLMSNSELELKGGKEDVLLGNTAYSSLVADARESRVRVNGRSYRGKIEIVKDNSSLLVINELNLEDYLAGLINHEISSRWPMEAVKAQAVVARTYALYQKKIKKYQRYDLESTVTSQVYGGSDSEDELALQAVKDTEGEVVLYDGELIQALYHSSCGGKTEAAEDVWGKDAPYLKSMKDPHCTEAPNYFWQYDITLRELGYNLRRLNSRMGDVRSLTVLKRSGTGRVSSLLVRHSRGSFEVAGKEFREAVGFDNLKSTNFTVKMKGGSFHFAGSGSGHGVGMCQWGAKGMADEGRSYKEILKWYYPGVTIQKADQ